MIRDMGVGIGIDIDTGPLANLDRTLNDIVRRLSTLDFSNLERLEVDDISHDFRDLDNTIERVDRTLDDLDRNDLNNLQSEVEETDGIFSKLKGGIVAVGTAIAAGFAVDRIKEFGMSAIEAAASAQATNAQFNEVFKGMEDIASDTLSKVSETTLMAEGRLKGSFLQIAAFAKTTGMETADALALTERATLAAADSAAFYDRSIEEVAENLQSFLKGNYENDASLGISATEFTRNAAAAELFGKKFKDLTEAQKQDTLLKMVEDGNKLSGALGQAAREGDAYENVMGNLSQAWQDFKIKIGGPLLQPFVNGALAATKAIQGFDTDYLVSKIESVISVAGSLSKTLIPLISNGVGIMKDAFSSVKSVIDAIYDSIMSLINDTGEVADIWKALGIPPEIAEGIATFGGAIRDTFLYAKDVVMQFVNDAIIPLIPVAQQYISSAFGYIGNVVDVATNIFGALKSAVIGLVENVIVPLIPVAQGVIETAFKIISPVLDVAGSLFKTISSIVSFLVQDIIVPLLPLAAAAITGAWAIMKPVLDAIVTAFDNIAKSVQWVIDKIGGAAEVLKSFNIGDKIGGVVSKVTSIIPGFEVGLGRVPYDDMPALLHKDEAVLPKEEADTLRNAGILKGEGTGPSLDFGTAASYNTAPVTNTTTTTSSIQAPVNIIVQGGNTNDETVLNIQEAMEEFFADLMATMPQVREG